jgi:hypothetical protein
LNCQDLQSPPARIRGDDGLDLPTGGGRLWSLSASTDRKCSVDNHHRSDNIIDYVI